MRSTVVFSKKYNTLAIVEPDAGAMPSDWFNVFIDIGGKTKIVELADLIFIGRL